MSTFRAYVLDPSGHIVWGKWIEADDQAEAERQAHKLCDQGNPTVELWQGSRQLAEIPCVEEQ
ncbi:MAG: hypothetical protein Q8R82_22945 [Hyphomonadaceae bacterium]|nr:hypothetical protein [Hyphomonadaceae bacterium]